MGPEPRTGLLNDHAEIVEISLPSIDYGFVASFDMFQHRQLLSLYNNSKDQAKSPLIHPLTGDGFGFWVFIDKLKQNLYELQRLLGTIPKGSNQALPLCLV